MCEFLYRLSFCLAAKHKISALADTCWHYLRCTAGTSWWCRKCDDFGMFWNGMFARHRERSWCFHAVDFIIVLLLTFRVMFCIIHLLMLCVLFLVFRAVFYRYLFLHEECGLTTVWLVWPQCCAVWAKITLNLDMAPGLSVILPQHPLCVPVFNLLSCCHSLLFSCKECRTSAYFVNCCHTKFSRNMCLLRTEKIFTIICGFLFEIIEVRSMVLTFHCSLVKLWCFKWSELSCLEFDCIQKSMVLFFHVTHDVIG